MSIPKFKDVVEVEWRHNDFTMHAERIASLEELVLVLRHCADECGDCDACPINDARPAPHA